MLFTEKVICGLVPKSARPHSFWKYTIKNAALANYRADASHDEVRKAAEDPDNFWVPDYGPDEAGLSVFWIHGRWIAVWRSLEEPEDAPAEVRWTVLPIGSDPEDGFGGLTFLEA